MLSAKALYSNVSDSPEELSFSQGDVLTVLEKDVGGLAGWWLCSLDGRTGIAPGNRLLALHRNHTGYNTNTHPGILKSSKSTSNGTQSDRVDFSKSPSTSYVYDVPHRTSHVSDVPGHSAVQTLNRNLPQQRDVTSYSFTCPATVKSRTPGNDNLNRSVQNNQSPVPNARPSDNGLYDSPLNLNTSDSRSPAARSDTGEYEVPSNASLQLPSSNRWSVFSTGSHESMSVSSARSSSCASVHSNASAHDASESPNVARANAVDFPVGTQSSRVSDEKSSNKFSDERAIRNESNVIISSKLRGEQGKQSPISTWDNNIALRSSNTTTKPYSATNFTYENRDSYLDDYSVPRSYNSASSSDSGISMVSASRRYDVPTGLTTVENLYDSPDNLILPENYSLSTANSVHNSERSAQIERNEAWGANAPMNGLNLQMVLNSSTNHLQRTPSPGANLTKTTTSANNFYDFENTPSKPALLVVERKPKLETSKSVPVHLEQLRQVQGRPLPSPPSPARNSRTFPRIESKSDVAVMVCPSVTSSCEWNEECDYVTIANDADKDKSQSLWDVQSTLTRSLGGVLSNNEKYAPADNRPLSRSFQEKLEAVQRSQSPLITTADRLQSCVVARESPFNNTFPMHRKTADNQPNTGTVPPFASKTMMHLSPPFRNINPVSLQTLRPPASSGRVSPASFGTVSPTPHSRAVVPRPHSVTPLQSSPLVIADKFDPFKSKSRSSLSEILSFYSSQADEVFDGLRATVDEYLRADRKTLMFYLHARAVVISAHRLVYIADALARASPSCADVAEAGNDLCDTLKTTVTAMKFASVALRDASAATRVDECVMAAVCDSATLVDVIHAKRDDMF